MKVPVAIVNAFFDSPNGGNPAGVVLNADQLTNEQKLKIAGNVGLSETAFVSRSDIADFKLDFYTPTRQIAHCGHATIAAFSLLSKNGSIKSPKTSKETIDGIRNIDVEGESIFMEQLKPTYKDIELEAILKSLGLNMSDVFRYPTIVSTGNGFLILQMTNMATLDGITVDEAMVNQISEEHDLIGFYVFTSDTNQPGRDASTRMFAPRFGISEESATGMAAGPLACYLHDYCGVSKDVMCIEQGYSMQPPSPSCIQVRLLVEGDKIHGVSAGGGGAVSSFIDVAV